MAEFSMELNEDQLQLQKWVHGFAEDVMRPNAAEWDEREEFPYPIVEEAAKIGLYGWEFMAEGMMGDPTGLTMPVAIEELFWGDAGIGMAKQHLQIVALNEDVLGRVPVDRFLRTRPQRPGRRRLRDAPRQLGEIFGGP